MRDRATMKIATVWLEVALALHKRGREGRGALQNAKFYARRAGKIPPLGLHDLYAHARAVGDAWRDATETP